MPHAIPPTVASVLHAYLAAVDQAAPGLLVGLYLHGSVAHGAYVEGRSDIDFIAVTARRCRAASSARLGAAHAALVQRFPHAQLEGSYLCWHDMGQPAVAIPPVPYIHDGVFHTGGSFDLNDVTWWTLMQRGIPLRGPAPDQLGFTVEWDTLLTSMYTNLNSYWATFTTNPARIAWLAHDAGIEWAVLGVLRQFYSFREHDITSKVGAGQYALAHTPARWHPLICTALALRAGTGARSELFFGRFKRAATARAFLVYIIAECNRMRGEAGRK